MSASRSRFAPYKQLPNLGLDTSTTQIGAIVAQGIEMEFKSQKRCFQVLKGIDLSISEGSIELLMGPSGSGKTTLLSILAGLMTPTKGKVYLLGEDVTAMSRAQLAKFRQQNIGFIFQNFNLFPALTAIENVEIALNIQGVRGKVAQEKSRVLLEQVGLENQANQKPGDLSGGQKQRVAIARALAGNPQLIMADEPTAALDSRSGHAVIELLRSLAKEQGCTVLMVTHDPRIVDAADRITYLEDGMLKQ
ncbi:ABC transporter ATP-binding protein [Aliterella atlantica]|uniref:ABC transporter ATP-binding protein n=1 Tax=Aliterella atlantica CENA595 TaxID=1618023 RepID=A0A0D8ZTW3_9CYAN|nr:ABC transporter ATP-binding protein [Aliterella atlantica]KJH71827.1 ABC transporter ATP-binding protein [Aliterella atlantica CENA595]